MKSNYRFVCRRLMSLPQGMGFLQTHRNLGLVSTSTISRKQDIKTTAAAQIPRIEDSLMQQLPRYICGLSRVDKLEAPLRIRPILSKIGSLDQLGAAAGSVRYMGIGSFTGGGRSAEHELRLPTPKPDGSKEKLEQDEREKFLESAKQDVAMRISDTEKTVRVDSVEQSSQSTTMGDIGAGATTELQFGVQDGASTSEAIDNAYEELLKKSQVSDRKQTAGGNFAGQSGLEETSSSTITDHDADNPHAEIASEVWSAMDSRTASPFLDDSDKVQVEVEAHHGQEQESMGISSSRGPGESLEDEATGPGETVRETLDATRAENRSGTGVRTPKPGVRVGNVPAVGASANETDCGGDIPTLSSKQQSTGGETLDRAQQQYEKSISEFGLGGSDQNLNLADPKKP